MSYSPAPTPNAKPLTAAQQALHKLGLRTDWDLALHIPLRYEDETQLTPLAQGRQGDSIQFEATVTQCEITMSSRRQLRVTVDDGSATCTLRFLVFYPSHQKALAVGQRVRVRGELRQGFWGFEMVHPTFKPAGGAMPTGLTPVYPTSAALPQAYIRKAVASGLGRAMQRQLQDLDVLEHVFGHELAHWHLPSLQQALHMLHHPPAGIAMAQLEDRTHPAWTRLKLEELLAQQLSQLAARRERDRYAAPVLQSIGTDAAPLSQWLLQNLPFGLTAAQQRVVAEVTQDVARTVPMNRLLQGDVGSGKTVVAALAACVCVDAGWQCALMAPTEILATQHFAKLIGWLEPLLAPRGQCVAWLTGSQKKKERTAMLALIASGQAAVVVGTHALIQTHVEFAKLALAIVDEQHRFGVAQRLALRSKMAMPQNGSAPLEPHLLMMTATPIPRTLAMSYYADLDVSTIDELPPGRSPIVTRVVPDDRRDELIARMGSQIAQGKQVYWVCPLIEEQPEAEPNTKQTVPATPEKVLRNVIDTHAELAAALPNARVAVLHSRLPVAEKRQIMADFASGQTHVLVSTTVIEVGVDVPNASLMIIEHAERFGLSQLHQLRGRVGRGSAASACVLLYTAPLSAQGKQRLKAMANTQDGFEIARIDLQLRGPGEFLGARQSGDALLRFADLQTDDDLLEWARQAAPHLLDQHPQLAQAHLQRWMGTRADYLKA